MVGVEKEKGEPELKFPEGKLVLSDGRGSSFGTSTELPLGGLQGLFVECMNVWIKKGAFSWRSHTGDGKNALVHRPN